MDRARAKKELFDGGGSGRDAFDTNENKGNKGPVVIRFAPFLVDVDALNWFTTAP